MAEKWIQKAIKKPGALRTQIQTNLDSQTAAAPTDLLPLVNGSNSSQDYDKFKQYLKDNIHHIVQTSKDLLESKQKIAATLIQKNATQYISALK